MYSPDLLYKFSTSLDYIALLSISPKPLKKMQFKIFAFTFLALLTTTVLSAPVPGQGIDQCVCGSDDGCRSRCNERSRNSSHRHDQKRDLLADCLQCHAEGGDCTGICTGSSRDRLAAVSTSSTL
ncbi:hypothetical protein K435DRAFT_783855, partial [Dendrothele bispora CBS 962.96]